MEQIKANRYDVIILDSLEGDCFRIHEDIREIPHGEVVILSGNFRIRKEAEAKRIPFYDKGKADESLTKILAKYSQ
jgi:hypothetical protein